MATNFSNTLVMDTSTDARLQALASFVDATMTGGGWVIETDSGDSDPATITRTATPNDKRGYRVYSMDDALQGTVPIFMRVDWGIGSAANRFAVWLTIGKSHDGAGGIGNMLLNAQQISGNTNSTTANNSYGAAGTSWLTIALGVATAATGGITFSLERTKDSNGNDSAAGLLLIRNGVTSTQFVQHSRFLNYTGANPGEEAGINYVISQQNPSTFDGNVGVGLVNMFAGAAIQPGLGIAVVKTNDFANEAQFTVTVYGAPHVYQHLNSGWAIICSQTNGQDSSVRPCIRFE